MPLLQMGKEFRENKHPLLVSLKDEVELEPAANTILIQETQVYPSARLYQERNETWTYPRGLPSGSLPSTEASERPMKATDLQREWTLQVGV